MGPRALLRLVYFKSDSSWSVRTRDMKSDGFFTGLGYWTRGNPEMCLLATKGKPKRISKSVPQLIVEKRREHSRKPDVMYSHIENLLQGPYIELFARQQRKGWDSYGNEVNKWS